MKRLFSLGIVLFMSFSLSAQDKAEFKFEKETIDYGTVNQSDHGKRVFVFTNTGNSPLVIDRIQTSCGCTVPKKPDQPILPGEKGEIEVVYDTKKVGGFYKAITIFSNAKTPRKVLKIKGVVEKVSMEKKKSIVSKETL